MPAMIWNYIESLAYYLHHPTTKFKEIVCTSGGFDPIHPGHIRCIQESAILGDTLIIIVNTDNFLSRKKGYSFMSLEERMEIIAAIKGVDHVVSWDDGTQFVDGALRILRPHIFTKGGDRSSPEAIAECEKKVCEKINCRIIYGVGGSGKAQSSSALVTKMIERYKDGNFR